MAKHNNIENLISNIQDLKWGRLKIERNNITKNNNQFVQVINTDAEGHLYFVLSSTESNDQNPEKKYYANLIFEDKSELLRYQLSGYACKEVANSEDEFSVIKFKIMQVEITDFKLEEKSQPQPIFSNILNLFWKQR